jgi:hypothetical protein
VKDAVVVEEEDDEESKEDEADADAGSGTALLAGGRKAALAVGVRARAADLGGWGHGASDDRTRIP